MKYENKEKVLMCCSELSVKGGMVSVVKNYLNYPDWNNYEIVYIPTHTEKNKIIVAAYFAIAYIKILYAKWLFSLMEKFESLIDISEYTTDQARIFGFLTERLLNVWIIKNNLKIKELPMIQTDSSLKFRIHMILNKVFKCSVKEGNKYSK